jgi:hypothetical protein
MFAGAILFFAVIGTIVAGTRGTAPTDIPRAVRVIGGAELGWAQYP